MPKITPFLWFDSQAEDAARFYCQVFPNSKITQVVRYGDGGPGPAGTVMTVAFELDGQTIVALNGGPHFALSEAFSFVIDCADQAEVDHYWDALTADGGRPSQCGWVKDRFGLSWQVVPRQLPQLVGGPDKAGARRAMAAMLKMGKLDIAKLKAAYDGVAEPA